jgi:hypothetical protein
MRPGLRGVVRKRHESFTKTPSNRHTSPVSWRRFTNHPNKPTRLNMKNFVSLRIATLVLVTGYMLKTTSADADVTFLGVAAGDATTNDAIVWTHQATAGRLNKIRGSGRRRPLGKNF